MVASPDGAGIQSDSDRINMYVPSCSPALPYKLLIQSSMRNADLTLSKEYPGQFEVADSTGLLPYVRRTRVPHYTNGNGNGVTKLTKEL